MKDENNVKVVKKIQKEKNSSFEARLAWGILRKWMIAKIAFDELTPFSFLTSQKFYAFRFQTMLLSDLLRDRAHIT